MIVNRLKPLSLIVFLCAFVPPVFAAWQAADHDGVVMAGIDNEHGQRIDLFVDDRNVVLLRINLSEGFETFAASSCPTFQIDRRKPMHHFELGRRCTVTGKQATIALGAMIDRSIRSLVMHRLMNGNNVTFRYTIGNGQYRQAQFSLSGSKQAMRQLLGYNPNIEVDEPAP